MYQARFNQRKRPYIGTQVRRHKPDYMIPLIASILLALGLVVMFAISPALGAGQSEVSGNYYVTRQLSAIILSIGGFVLASRVKMTTWSNIRLPLVISGLVLMIGAVLIGGIANRWIQFSIFSFQPVELTKFALIIFTASFLGQFLASGQNSYTWQTFKPLLILLALTSFIILVLQKDLGSLFVLIAILFVMVFIAGVPLRRLLLGVAAVGLVGFIAITSTPYRRERLATFFQPERDCVDTGYHACQALIAVGSGGIIGKGVGKSVQAYGYLPEASNDSIFAIYAEKFGFIGSLGLFALFGALLSRMLKILQRTEDMVSKLFVAGVFTWIGVQSAVNIGAMIGLLPLKGITLPFISYGGSSLVFVMSALGIVFNISSYTSIRSNSSKGSYDSVSRRGRVGRPYHPNLERSF